MAAVVSSLAAFIIGCGVPGIPGVGGGQGRERELGGTGGDCSGEAVWSSSGQAAAGQDAGLDLVAVEEIAKAIVRGRQQTTALADGSPPGAIAANGYERPPKSASAPAEGRLHAKKKKHQQSPRVATPRSPPRSALWPPRALSDGSDPEEGRRRGTLRVTFDLKKKTEHQVTPYSEVYGKHPREFDFGTRRGRGGLGRAPPDAWRFVDPTKGAEEEESDDEEDMGWVKSHLLSGRLHVPRHVFFTFGVAMLLLRMFGKEVLSDAVSMTL